MRLFNRPFLPLSVAFTLGIWTGGLPIVISAISISSVIMAAVLCFSLTVAELFYCKQTRLFPLLLFCFLGWLSIAPFLNPRVTPQHIATYVDNSKQTLNGLVVSNPQFNQERQLFELAVTEIAVSGELRPVKGKIRVTYAENAIMVPYGAAVTVKGYLREIHGFTNPAGFNYERFMALKQISGSMYVNPGDLHIYHPEARGAYILKQLYRFKNHFAARLDANAAGPAKGVLEALLTGSRHNIDPEVTTAFSQTGLSHVLAISGLHVGIVSLCFVLLLKLALKMLPIFKAPHRRHSAALVIALLPVLVYCIFSGFAPSTQRAFIVLVIFVGGFAALRTQDSFNAAVTAALLILLLFPDALFSVSFQLSFAAIFGITFGYRMLTAAGLTFSAAISSSRRRHTRFLRGLSRIFHWAASCAFMSLCAILATTPIVMHYFFNAGWIGLLLNLLMIPLLTFIVLPCGLLAMLLAWWPWLAGVLIRLAAFCLNRGIEVTLYGAALPHTSGKWFAPTLWELLCYYVLLFSLWYWLVPERRHRNSGGFFKARLATPVSRLCFSLIIASALGLSGSAAYWLKDRYYRSDVKITFIDIGQGNAAFIEFPQGYNVLIDGGGFRSTSGFDVGKNVLEPFLRQRKVAAIDTIILTHGDYDHVGGLFYIVENFKVGHVWLPDFASKESLAFMETMQTAGVPYSFAAQDDHLRLSPGYTAKVLNPPADITRNYLRKKPDVNDCSLVLQIACGEYTLLFTGDISKQVEAYLIGKYGQALQSNILLSPHHGSKTSNSLEFIRAVQPLYAVFSAGYNNNYKFPHPEILQRYSEQNSVILRTDLMGALELRLKDERLRLKAYRPGTAPASYIPAE